MNEENNVIDEQLNKDQVFHIEFAGKANGFIGILKEKLADFYKIEIKLLRSKKTATVLINKKNIVQITSVDDSKLLEIEGALEREELKDKINSGQKSPIIKPVKEIK